MKIKILFNSETIDNKFSIGWGLSVLINGNILFDTGERGDYLITNLEKMNIDIENIDAVVISHDHWDHIGGLGEILKGRKGIKVYSLPNFSRELKEKVGDLEGRLLENKNFSEIAKDIFVTGEISGTYNGKYIPEQAVVVKTEKGLTVITGCSHPGILNILDTIKERFPEERFYLVFGGFHLKNNDKGFIDIIVDHFKEMNIQKVGPTHCTGKEAETLFREKYRDNYISIKSGQIIEV